MTAPAEVTTKLEKVRRWLRESGSEAILFSSQGWFAWITAGADSHVSLGDATGAAWVLVTEARAFLVAANNELPRFRDELLAGLPFEPISWPWHAKDGGAQAVARLCAPQRALSDLGVAGLTRAPEDLARLRFTLVPDEIERYRRLCCDAAQVVEQVCEAARPGQSELEIAAAVAGACRASDILALVVFVGTDERIAKFRHPLPTATRVGRQLLVALTGRRHGLHASLTRLVSFGRPDEDLTRRQCAVARVDARLILQSRQGATLGEVLAAGIEQYAAEGFAAEWEQHHQGGLTGYGGREVFATRGAPLRLQAGQVLAWNPSIRRVKSEDTILVTQDAPEVLTLTSRWPREPVRLPIIGAIDRSAILVR